MLALLFAAALQAQTTTPGQAFRGTTAEEVEAGETALQNFGSAGAEAPEQRDRQSQGRPDPAPSRAVDDRFATPQGAPPASRRITVPNPHDPERSGSNPR